MINKRYFVLDNDIADIFKGHSKSRLNYGIEKAINNSEEFNCNINQFIEHEQIKILGWKQIKEYANNKLDDKCDTINISAKYSSAIKYMQKGDIVFPVATSRDNIEIVYIEDEPSEKYIYDETVWVVRIINQDIESKYVYIMCLSDPIQKGLIELKEQSERVITKLTKEIISSIHIKKVSIEEQQQIITKYNMIQQDLINFHNKINNVQTSNADLSAKIWTQE